jgi:hypothetical protein
MRLIAEPDIDKATLEDWQRFILRTTIQGGGFMLVDIANMETDGVPVVRQGSRLEINGAFYKAEADEAVGGSPASGENFVYAVPNGDGVTFQYSAVKPEWSAVKGGWYNGNNRAVLRVAHSGGVYYFKEILDRRQGNENMSGNAIQQKKILTSIIGTPVKTITPASGLADRHFRLEPGMYCFEVAGGGAGGGGGGSGSTRGDAGGGAGCAGGRIIESVVIVDSVDFICAAGGGGAGGAGGSGIAEGIGGNGGTGGGSYVAAFGYLLAAAGGGAGGGGGGSGIFVGGAGGGGGAGAIPLVEGITNDENGQQIAKISASGGSGGRGGESGGSGSGGTGGGNNRNAASGGGGYGNNGANGAGAASGAGGTAGDGWVKVYKLA